MKYKKFRKYVQFYQLNFNLQPPYVVIADLNFLTWCNLKNLYETPRILNKVMDDESYFHITKCVEQKLLRLPKDIQSKIKSIFSDLSSRVIDCPISGPHDPRQCFMHLGKNYPGEYCFASQNTKTRRSLSKECPGCPLLYVAINVLMLERPSNIDRLAVKERESSSQIIDPELKKEVKKAKKELTKKPKPKNAEAKKNYYKTKMQRKKKAKGPNPLCLKKKKRKENEQRTNNNTSEPKKKRTRRKTPTKTEIDTTQTEQ